MDKPVQFSDVCGENISITDGKKAHWKHTYSGGVLFSGEPITKDSRAISVDLNGSSHVDVGFVQADPSGFTRVRDVFDQNSITILNSIKVHRRQCTVRMSVTNDQVVSRYGDQEFKMKITGTKVWMVIYIKFGNVIAEIAAGNLRFHDVRGENITFIPNTNKRAAKLSVENPAAVCMIYNEETSTTNFRVKLKIGPLTERGRPPSRYHVILGVSNVPPYEWYDYDAESLSVSHRSRKPNKWRQIVQFEGRADGVNTCEGELTIERTHEGDLAYKHSYRESKLICNERDWCCVVLELFRSEMEILPFDDDSYSSVYSAKASSSDTDSVKVRDEVFSQVPLRQRPEARTPVQHHCDQSISLRRSDWLMSRVQSMELCIEENKDSNLAMPAIENKLSSIVSELKSDGKEEEEGDYLTPVTFDIGEHAYDTLDNGKEIKERLDRIEAQIKDVITRQQQGKHTQDKLYAKLGEIKSLMFQQAMKPEVQDKTVDMPNVIRRNYSTLRSRITSQVLCDELLQSDILSFDQHDKLRKMRNSTSEDETNRELLSMLRTVSVSTDTFCDILQRSNHGHLQNIFKDD